MTLGVQRTRAFVGARCTPAVCASENESVPVATDWDFLDPFWRCRASRLSVLTRYPEPAAARPMASPPALKQQCRLGPRQTPFRRRLTSTHRRRFESPRGGSGATSQSPPPSRREPLRVPRSSAGGRSPARRQPRGSLSAFRDGVHGRPARRGPQRRCSFDAAGALPGESPPDPLEHARHASASGATVARVRRMTVNGAAVTLPDPDPGSVQ